MESAPREFAEWARAATDDPGEGGRSWERRARRRRESCALIGEEVVRVEREGVDLGRRDMREGEEE